MTNLIFLASKLGVPTLNTKLLFLHALDFKEMAKIVYKTKNDLKFGRKKTLLGTPRCKIWVQSQHSKQGKHRKPHRNKLYQGRSRDGYSGSSGEPASTDDLT